MKLHPYWIVNGPPLAAGCLLGSGLKSMGFDITTRQFWIALAIWCPLVAAWAWWQRSKWDSEDR